MVRLGGSSGGGLRAYRRALLRLGADTSVSVHWSNPSMSLRMCASSGDLSLVRQLTGYLLTLRARVCRQALSTCGIAPPETRSCAPAYSQSSAPSHRRRMSLSSFPHRPPRCRPHRDDRGPLPEFLPARKSPPTNANRPPYIPADPPASLSEHPALAQAAVAKASRAHSSGRLGRNRPAALPLPRSVRLTANPSCRPTRPCSGRPPLCRRQHAQTMPP